MSAGPVSADIYKWVDETGQVHYGEQPAGPDAEKVKIRTNETTKPRPVNKTEKKDASAIAKEKQQAAEEKKKQALTKKDKKKYCNEASSDLAAINSRGRMREINAKGEYIYLTEAQRQQRIAAAKKKQQEFCR
ncbi:MAG: DUF4124 domain-containing protein [Gammaproteobacteria bacterium]|nr:DUF4124 domain-containing protein [Gammaproteobacteria bacterium]